MKKSLASILADATGLDETVVYRALSTPKTIEQGDIAFPCFLLAKSWKISPDQCAVKLSTMITLPPTFIRSECQGAYLNFFLNRETATRDVTKSILSRQVTSEQSSKGTIVIDYSGPNISKPFHVGHLRTTIIGFSLYKLFSYLGYNVIGVNHLGDWGTQFGFVYAGCSLWGKPKDDMNELVSRYVEANLLRKSQEAGKDLNKPLVNDIARDYFIRLEAGDPEAVEFWKWNLDISKKYYERTYARMGITFDSWNGESFYAQFFDQYINELKASGILEESRGAFGVDLGKQLGFARLLTEDGRTLYLTRDLITADYRENTYNPERIIYVVGAPQALHFKQLREILRKMGRSVAEKIVHIPYGHVPGISTRSLKTDSGDISLDALLDEAQDRAKEAYESAVSKRPEDVDVAHIAQAVGLGAIYFNYLSRTNNKEFHFSWEEALNFKGDTGPYLMYAVARLHSIEEKAKAAGIEVSVDCDYSCLQEREAWELTSILRRFTEVLEKTAVDYEPCNLCNYALDLAKSISRAYLKLRVVGEDNIESGRARLALFMAAREVLTTSLTILGITPLRRM
jgi:arginyl-tRNA synthetase